MCVSLADSPFCQLRVSKEQEHFLVLPEGLAYSEVTGSSLVSQDFCVEHTQKTLPVPLLYLQKVNAQNRNLCKQNFRKLKNLKYCLRQKYLIFEILCNQYILTWIQYKQVLKTRTKKTVVLNENVENLKLTKYKKGKI